VGQIFYSVISLKYYNTLRTLKDPEEEKKLLRKWYSFEHSVREDAGDFWLDRIGKYTLRYDMPDFYHLLARKQVFDTFVKEEGRLWIKLRLKAALDQGHREVETLYNQMDREDEALEFARMEREERRRRLREEAEQKYKERHKAQVSELCDSLERTLDLLGGGMGLTNQEQLDSGGKDYMNFLKDRDVRKALEEILR
jgi:hypothetical protein